MVDSILFPNIVKVQSFIAGEFEMDVEKLLPSNFDNRIVELKLINADEENSLNFIASIYSNCHSKSEVISWLESFKSSSSTDWIHYHHKSGGDRSDGFYSFLCHHSNYRKTNDTQKGTNCAAKITFRVQKNTKFTRKTADVRNGRRLLIV